MHCVVSGGTGFLGTALTRELSLRGDEVSVLTRKGELGPALDALPRVRAVRWDPREAGAWQECVDGADAVVHLAGEQAVGRRYTAELKQRILESRVVSGKRLVEAIAVAQRRPRVLVSASGVGYYGGRLDAQPLDEASPPGRDFLAEVCVAWEAAVHGAEASGVRVATARLGAVLGRDGGALAEMARPFRMLVGGPIGSGRQYFSWIHRDDAVRVFLRLLDDATLSGPVNAVAPRALPQAELAQVMGRVLRRPAVVRAPAFALKALFGDGAVPILTGQNAVPRVLTSSGFTWKFPELEAALHDCLDEPGA